MVVSAAGGVAQEPLVEHADLSGPNVDDSRPGLVDPAHKAMRRLRKKRRGQHRMKAGRSENSQREMWESEHAAWEAIETDHSNRGYIFDKLVISHDGGISDIGPGKKEDLWYRSRYFSMLVTVGFIFYNVIFIAYTDIEIVSKAGQETGDGQFFLVVNKLIDVLTDGKVQIKSSWSSAVVAIIELAFLVLNLLMIGFNVLGVCCRTGYTRWFSVHRLLKERLPDLSSFSAMQLLYYVNTSIVTNDVFYALFYAPPRWRIPHMLWLVVSRPLCLIVGMDCFLIKYRAASDNINTPDINFVNVFTAFLLLNQILGVVRLNWAVRDRLFRFVFGGEDGVMTPREVVRMKIWHALVTQRIFLKYPWRQAMTLCLTWNDDDFQLLILDEPELRESQMERESQRLHEVMAPEGTLHSTLRSSGSPCDNLRDRQSTHWSE